MGRRNNPFSYQIDYDKALAEDEVAIAYWTKIIEAKLFAEQPGDRIIDVVVCCGGWERLGLTRQDALDLRDEFEYREADLPGDIPSSDSECYRNANKVYDEHLEPLDGHGQAPTEATAKKELKRAKAALARHRRNKEKYGG